MLTPLPWRRPWKVASQAATLDQLSGGRAILAVGLGAVGTGLERTGEATDRRTRAELLDEGLEVITGLWDRRMTFGGRHYQVDLGERQDLAAVGAPVQRPRIPIWVVAGGPRPGFDAVMEGETPAGDPRAARALVAPWEDAGCTWWLDARWEMPHESPERMRQVRERLEAGPPRRA
jgi:Luciferase-like monooxygenase